jgi:hypothetical protein
MQSGRKAVAFLGMHSCRAANVWVRCTFPLVTAILALPVPARGQRTALELRAGVIYSSALAEDRVANPALTRQLGERFGGSVRARPAPGAVLGVAVQSPLRQRSLLELAAAWSRAGLSAEDASGRRHMQNLHAVQATLAVRYRVAIFDAGCGFGALRYFASGGLFSGGSGDLAPVVECGAGWLGGPGRRAVLRALAQAHRFRTPVLRDAGAQTGTVFRLSIQAGVRLGIRP